MSNAFAFLIYSNFAFFKKEAYNKKFFTYGHIHKPVIIGLLGSIIGLKGYNNGINNLLQKIKGNKKTKIPEFNILKELEISIIPLNFEKNIITKFPQLIKENKNNIELILENNIYSSFEKFFNNYNNSHGLFSYVRNDGAYQINEQTLYNPAWLIFIKKPNKSNLLKFYDILQEKIKNKKSTFLPYLGQNTYPASVEYIAEYEINPTDSNEYKIHSLFFLKDNINDITFNNTYYKEILPFDVDYNIPKYKKQTFFKINESIKSDYLNKQVFNIYNTNINLFFF